jgi:hypothetical protein
MLLSPTDLRDIHAAFGTAAALVEDRRAVYAAVVELVDGRTDGGVPPDLLDSPPARAHLGTVIGAVARYRPDALVRLSELIGGAAEFVSATARTFVVADPSARGPLDSAIVHIARELGRHGTGADGIQLMLADDPAFAEASSKVVEGVRIAVKVCPELAEDLLPHVALFAIIRHGGTEYLGSASVRGFPGLVVVPRPSSAVEIAEALVHEGAHQKFFDLGITRSLLAADIHRAPSYSASWSGSAAPRWPLEQCAAAFHAYTCLATFYESVRESDLKDRLHDFSLLPSAEARAAELGEWLSGHEHFFGPDGRRFLAALAGRRPDLAPARSTAQELPASDAPTVRRQCGERALIARMDDHIALYWVSPRTSFGAVFGSSETKL